MICCQRGPRPASPALARPVLAGPGLAGGPVSAGTAKVGTVLGHSGPELGGGLGPEVSGAVASTTAITPKAGAPRHARSPAAPGRGSQRRRRRLIANHDNGRAGCG